MIMCRILGSKVSWLRTKEICYNELHLASLYSDTTMQSNRIGSDVMAYRLVIVIYPTFLPP